MCALPMDSQWRDLKLSEVISFAIWQCHSGFSVEDVLAVPEGGVERADDCGWWGGGPLQEPRVNSIVSQQWNSD